MALRDARRPPLHRYRSGQFKRVSKSGIRFRPCCGNHYPGAPEMQHPLKKEIARIRQVSIQAPHSLCCRRFTRQRRCGMRAPALSLLCVLSCTLASCDQGPKSEAGPPGERGPPGPPGSALHIVRTTCDDRSCLATCADDEIVISAWCGAARNPTSFPNERSAACRGRAETNNPLVAVCAKMVGASPDSVEPESAAVKTSSAPGSTQKTLVPPTETVSVTGRAKRFYDQVR